MQELSSSFAIAFSLIGTLDADLFEIVGLSLRVSLSAVGLSLLIGLPVGAAIAIGRFPGRFSLIVISNSLMGMPPVVVGLLVYLALSRAGPFGVLGLLYTPTAMVIAQTLLFRVYSLLLVNQHTAIEEVLRKTEDKLTELIQTKYQIEKSLIFSILFCPKPSLK